jgi:uncharacterized protein
VKHDVGQRAAAEQAAIQQQVDEHASADDGDLCSHCEAVCCRLTVVLMPDDRVPRWFVAEDEHGPDTMAKAADGWCVALDRDSMRCTIYERRPQICRSFSMGGAYCRDERSQWAQEHTRDGIPFVWR